MKMSLMNSSSTGCTGLKIMFLSLNIFWTRPISLYAISFSFCFTTWFISDMYLLSLDSWIWP